MNQLSLSQASAKYGQAPALKLDGVTYSFVELQERAQAHASSLVTEERGSDECPEVVRVETTPSLDNFLTLYATLDRGAVAHLIPQGQPDPLKQHRRQMVADAKLLPGDAILIETSGSTGDGRVVVHTHQTLLSAVRMSFDNLGFREDRWLLNLPLAHIGGLSVVLRCLVYGQTVVSLPAKVAPHEFERFLGDEGITLLSLVPTQLARLLSNPEFHVPPSVRAILVGGAPLAQALHHEARARGVPVLCTYGMTEAASQVATQSPHTLAAGDVTPSPQTCGKPLSGVTVRISPDDGRILIHSPALARTYLGEPLPLTADGYLITTDQGALNDDGELQVFGRLDNIIISGGENISAEQVESALIAALHLPWALCLGIPDNEWGQKVTAIIPAGGATGAIFSQEESQLLRARLRPHLPAQALPRQWLSLSALPKLPSGKPSRKAALAQALQMLATSAQTD